MTIKNKIAASALLLLIIIAAPNAFYAQTPKAVKYEYCEAHPHYSGFNDKTKVAVDFGNSSTLKYRDMYLKDEYGNPITFDSKVAFLNYFSELGWELTDTRTSVSDGSTSGIYYTFRRPVVIMKSN